MLAQGEVMYPHPALRSVPELGGFEVSAVELDSETDLLEKLLFCVCVWQPSESLKGLKAVLEQKNLLARVGVAGRASVCRQGQRPFGHEITGKVFMHQDHD